MAEIKPFRKTKRLKSLYEFAGQRWPLPSQSSPPPQTAFTWGPVQWLLAALGLALGALLGLAIVYWLNADSRNQAGSFVCAAPEIIDGDTIHCGTRRVRLEGIDAPELPGHCRPGRKCTPGDPYASTANLQRLVNGASLQCSETDIDVYGRSVARCTVGEIDLSCAQLDAGQAVRRYGRIWCGW